MDSHTATQMTLATLLLGPQLSDVCSMGNCRQSLARILNRLEVRSMLNLLSHFMKYLVILVGLVLTANVQSHPSVCQQSKQRDLSKYDFGGAFEVKVSREGIGRVDAEVRAFIWRHVKEQQLGYVSVTHYSKEGEPSTSTYFVEQDENGGWHMLVRIERRIIDNRESTFSK